MCGSCTGGGARISPIAFAEQPSVLVLTEDEIRASMVRNPLPSPGADTYPEARSRLAYEDDMPTPLVTTAATPHQKTHRALEVPAGTEVRVGKTIVLDSDHFSGAVRKGEVYSLEGLPHVLFYVVSVTKDGDSIKVKLIVRPMCDTASKGETFVIPDDELLVHVPAPTAYCADAEFIAPARYYWLQRPHYRPGPHRPPIRPHPRPPGPVQRPLPVLSGPGPVRTPQRRPVYVNTTRTVSAMTPRRRNRLERREARRAVKAQAMAVRKTQVKLGT